MIEIENEPGGASGRLNRTGRWARGSYRALMVLTAVLVVVQTVFAGGFLNGRYAMLDMHAANATALGVTTSLALAAALVWWKPGGGPGRLPIATAGLLAAEAAQITIGYARILILHVPLGVAVVIGVVQLMIAAFENGDRA